MSFADYLLNFKVVSCIMRYCIALQIPKRLQMKMTARVFNKERERYKRLFRNKLNEILTTDRTKTIIRKFQLTEYKFKVAEKIHHATVIDLMAKGYTKNSPLHIVIDLDEDTCRKLMKPSMQAKLDAGRVIIIIDQGICVFSVLKK